jgi:hypothetical protein
MNKSKEVEEEYLSLRDKVEGRIKELEGKMGHAPSASSQLQMPQNHHCHHNCHHHCHGGFPPTANFFYPAPRNAEMSRTEYQNSSDRLEVNKTNELISEALVESLKNQRQINDHIKAINEKI